MAKDSGGEVYDPIRGEWVASLPEEVVRQQLLSLFIEELGVPRELIGVEKALRDMPHISSVRNDLPDRRADIIVYGKAIHPSCDLYPLLLVECKAVKISPAVIRQVTGYNHYVGAYFVVVANADEVRTGWYDSLRAEYVFIDGIPSYGDLISGIKF